MVEEDKVVWRNPRTRSKKGRQKQSLLALTHKQWVTLVRAHANVTVVVVTAVSVVMVGVPAGIVAGVEVAAASVVAAAVGVEVVVLVVAVTPRPRPSTTLATLADPATSAVEVVVASPQVLVPVVEAGLVVAHQAGVRPPTSGGQMK